MPRPKLTKRAGGRAEKAASRRDAILAAALDEFTAKGFAATRLDDVARRAKVAKGTIYLHFRDKEALFQEIVRAVVSPLIGALEALPPADQPLRATVDRLVEVFIHEIYGTRRKDVIRLMISEGRRFPTIAEFYFREVVERGLKAIRAIMRRARERGEIDTDLFERFPQILIAPGLVGIIWEGLFDAYEPLDVAAMMRSHIDHLFAKRRAG